MKKVIIAFVVTASLSLVTSTHAAGIKYCGALADLAKMYADDRGATSIEDQYADIDKSGGDENLSSDDVFLLKHIARLTYPSMGNREPATVRALIDVACIAGKLDAIIDINVGDSKHSSVPLQ